MAESKVKGLEGKENIDYTRDAVPERRWSDAWTVFKSNFSKVVLSNLLTLVFFLPLIIVIYSRMLYVNSLADLYPFGAVIGPVSVPSVPDLSGLAEGLNFSADLIFYSVAVAAGLIAAVGLAGSFYSMKKLLITHGKFTVKSYFRGVKKCYIKTALPMTLFMAVFFCTMVVSSWKDYTISLGNDAAWPIAAKVLMIILCVVVGVVSMWLIAVGVSYKASPGMILKNSFAFLFKSILQTLIILGIAFIPVWLLLMGSIMQVIAAVIFIVFGFSYISIAWMGFTQWVFDIFFPPEITSRSEAVRSNMSEREIAAEKEENERRVARENLVAGKSELLSRPVLPLEETNQVKALGKSFTRSQIAEVSRSRTALKTSIADYENKHKGEKRYVEYNKMFAEREKALNADEGKKGKKKNRISADRLLR